MAQATSSKRAEGSDAPDGRSLSLSLTLWFTLVTALVIGITGIFLDRWLSADLEERTRAQLEADFEHFRHLLAESASREELAGSHWFAADPRHSGGPQASAIDTSGKILAGSPPFEWPSELVQRAKDEPAHELIRTEARAYSVLLGPARIGGGADAVLVGIALDKQPDDAIVLHFRVAALVAWLLASAAAAALGYFAARRGLRPLRRMVEAAARIRAENLNERLDAENAPLEIRDLAQSFNAMLERLDRSFRRLSDFSSDLAHELRSPLSSLMLQAQVALGKPRNEAELRLVLESGLEELERLSRMANDMLFLAKAEHAGHLLQREPVSLAEEAGKVFEYFEPLASERGVRLELRGAARVLADRSMIRRMIANLVSNAVRYATPGSVVAVACEDSDSTAALQVTNQGVELSPEDCERVFDRFYRVESSRRASAEGAGLGLAIVKSIVELHGGRIGVESGSGRTTFRLRLPGVPRA